MTHEVYKITKLVCGKYGGRKVAPVKDLQGRLLTTEREQEARWAEHFMDVLNRPPPTVEADIQEAETDLDVNTDPPNKQEIIAAIKIGTQCVHVSAIWKLLSEIKNENIGRLDDTVK